MQHEVLEESHANQGVSTYPSLHSILANILQIKVAETVIALQQYFF